MKAEICCCNVLVNNYILCNKVVLDYKIIYLYKTTEHTTGMSHLDKKNEGRRYMCG